jgi:dolichol-phosphate mannosyltransferase
MDKIVIVMPAWNEGENLQTMVESLVDKEFPKIKADMHLLVVDNNSKDGTEEIIKKAQQTRKNLHFIQQGDKSGLGWAYVRGFQYAVEKLKADAVMEMDADGQHPPEYVKPMIEAYLNGADYVIGSRYIPGGSIPKEWGFSRKLMSFFGNLYARVVLTKFSIHDMTTGFRLTRVNGVLDKIDLENLRELERFAYKIDLLYQSIKNAKKIVEVPLEFRPRTTDKSKFNIKEMIASYKTVMILGIKDKAKFIKFGTVGFMGYLVNAVGLYLFTKWNFASAFAWGLSTELAIINNFIFNNAWTFKSEKIAGIGNLTKKFLQFNGTSIGALLIQTTFGSLSDYLFGPGKRQLALPFIIVLLVLPYNYFMYNVVIWKSWDINKLFKKK